MMKHTIEHWKLSSEMENKFEWRKWMVEIPYISFPSELKIKIIPPFAGAVVRFHAALKDKPDHFVSIYLDCYDILGWVGQPYWELYPDSDGDTFRCAMKDTDELLQAIDRALKNRKKYTDDDNKQN